ncbi:MAG: DUF2612 domain-containing protein [Methanobrevibacter sp.]|nr:DUF2612 domain-containing protein [Methanobrevibacter sp.]
MSQELTVTVPEDIKLELDSGTLTLKAGSKVYVPNGSGVFNIYIVQIDSGSGDISTISEPYMFFVNTASNSLSATTIGNIYSGQTAPTASIGTFWYDTTNNSVKRYNGSSWVSGFSLPICIISSGATSIKQVFNGFGYIGNELFVVKDVSANVPMGFNDDGTALFETYTTDRVLIGEKTTDYPYLVGSNGHFTGIYCASSYNNYRAGANLFFENMKVLARPLNSDTIEVNPSLSYTTRLIGQYANSPVMLKLANGLGTLFDDSPFIKNWYDVIFNLETANGYGLDVWGAILNRSREFIYNGNRYYLQGAQTIGGVDFTAEQMENLYRKVLQLTAMRYIGNASIASLNTLIQFIFKDDGECYCLEYGTMYIRYVFRFYLNDVQKAIIETIDPHPSGVESSYEYLPTQTYFGFIVRGVGGTDQPYLPFDNGPFYR